jgi:sulfoxide reductase heme-binding subunit YedZ
VYAAAALGALHFLWLVKADWREPAVYIAIYLALMAWRWHKRPGARTTSSHARQST